MLLTGLLPLAGLAPPLILPRPAHLGMALPTGGWAILHQLAIKEMLLADTCGPIYGGDFSAGVPSLFPGD